MEVASSEHLEHRGAGRRSRSSREVPIFSGRSSPEIRTTSYSLPAEVGAPSPPRRCRRIPAANTKTAAVRERVRATAAWRKWEGWAPWGEQPRVRYDKRALTSAV